MKKRTLIILVAILVLLYIVATTMPFILDLDAGADPENPPPWIGSIGAPFSRQITLEAV